MRMLLPDLQGVVHEFVGRPTFPYNMVCWQIHDWSLCGGRDANWHFRIIASARPQAPRQLLHMRMLLNFELEMVFEHFHKQSPSTDVPEYVEYCSHCPLDEDMMLMTPTQAILQTVHEFNQDPSSFY